MSWEPWLDGMKCNSNSVIKACGIYGLDGSPYAEWQDAGHEECKVDRNTILAAVSRMNGTAAEVKVGGEKQIVISGESNRLVAKKGSKSSLVVLKCNSCVVVAAAGEGSEPRGYEQYVNTTAEGLKNAGY